MSQLAILLGVWILGLCVGSFLNVVVYRLGAGLSIASPRWSFCPGCRSTIRWWDNIPVLSWLVLRGRCRRCRMTVSVQYPLVESATGLAFALVYALLFVVGAHADFHPELPGDIPLLLAWLVLTAALVACAAMDVVSYSIDIRVTFVATVVGLLLHTVWPRGDVLAAAASTPASAAALAALAIALLVSMVRKEPIDAAGEPEAAAHASPAPPEAGLTRVLGGVGTLVLCAIALWMALTVGGVVPVAGEASGIGIGLGALFLTLVLAGGAPRAADAEIAAAIEVERPAARGVAGRELLLMLPAALGGVAAFVAARQFAPTWQRVMSLEVAGGWTPLAGIAYAVAGLVVAAAAGWVLRIVFTLIYGREALGVGDIHILAAAGACAGWEIAILGLVLSVGFALAGWAVGLLLKRTAMIPLGPWLAVGFIAALWLHKPASAYVGRHIRLLGDAWRDRPDIVLVFAGVMLLAAALAILLSRLLRRLVAPDEV